MKKGSNQPPKALLKPPPPPAPPAKRVLAEDVTWADFLKFLRRNLRIK